MCCCRIDKANAALPESEAVQSHFDLQNDLSFRQSLARRTAYAAYITLNETELTAKPLHRTPRPRGFKMEIYSPRPGDRVARRFGLARRFLAGSRSDGGTM